MKKMIAILATFALIGGAAFAQPNVGGQLSVTADLLKSGTDDEVHAGPLTMYEAQVNFSFGDESAGGLMRLWHTGIDWNPGTFAFMWWKPIEQLRIQIGANPDGDWGHAQISGWGYNGEAQQGASLDEHRGLNSSLAIVARNTSRVTGSSLSPARAFAPGLDSRALLMSITPAEGLAINIGIPIAASATPTAKNLYGNTLLDVVYAIEDVGTLRVAAKLNGFDANDDLNPVDLNLAFHLNSIQGMGLEFGLGYKTADANDNANPLGVGVGFQFGADDFNIKARLGASLAGEDKLTVIALGILPSYNINSNMVGYLNAGFGIGLPDEGDSRLDWFVNPYLMVRAANGVRVYFGLKAQAEDDGDVVWSIPMVIRAYF